MNYQRTAAKQQKHVFESEENLTSKQKRLLQSYKHKILERDGYLLGGNLVPDSLLKTLSEWRKALGIPTSAIIILIAMLSLVIVPSCDAQDTVLEKYAQGWGKRAVQKFGNTSELLHSSTSSTATFNLQDYSLAVEKFSLKGFSFEATVPGFGSKMISFDGVTYDLDKDIVLQMKKNDIYWRNGFTFPFGYVTYSQYKGLLAGQNPITQHFADGKVFNSDHISTTLSRLVTQSPNDKAWQIELGLRVSDFIFGMHEARVEFGSKRNWWIGGDITYAWVIGKEGTYRATLSNLGIDIRSAPQEFLQNIEFTVPIINEQIGLSDALVESGVELAAGYIENQLLDFFYIFGDPLLKGNKWSIQAEAGWKGLSFRYRYSQEKKRNFLTAAALNEIGGNTFDAQPGPWLRTTSHELSFIISLDYQKKNAEQSQLVDKESSSKKKSKKSRNIPTIAKRLL